MQGIRPENLSDKELVRYATLEGSDKLNPAWVANLLNRFAEMVDSKESPAHAVPPVQNKYRRPF